MKLPKDARLETRSDIASVASLADELGSEEAAHEVLREADVRIIGGHYSRAALDRAIAMPRSSVSAASVPQVSVAPEDAELLAALSALLGKHGLAIASATRRRAVEVTVVPTAAHQAVTYRSWVTAGHEEEDDDHPLPDTSDEDISIWADSPKRVRVYRAKRPREGALDFTVGLKTEGAEFVLFVSPEVDRGWIFSVADLREGHRHLERVKAGVPGYERGAHWPNLYLNKAPNTLKVVLTGSGASAAYSLEERLAATPR